MKKRIFSMVLILLLAVSFTGCSGSDPDTKVFKNDILSFSYPSSYREGNFSKYEYVFPSDDNWSFRFFIFKKSEMAAEDGIDTEDVTPEKLAERYIHIHLKNLIEADVNYTLERNESPVIDGENAKLVYFAGPEVNRAFLIIECGKGQDSIVIFEFTLEKKDGADKIIEIVQDSIKFK